MRSQRGFLVFPLRFDWPTGFDATVMSDDDGALAPAPTALSVAQRAAQALATPAENRRGASPTRGESMGSAAGPSVDVEKQPLTSRLTAAQRERAERNRLEALERVRRNRLHPIRFRSRQEQVKCS